MTRDPYAKLANERKTVQAIATKTKKPSGTQGISSYTQSMITHEPLKTDITNKAIRNFSETFPTTNGV